MAVVERRKYKNLPWLGLVSFSAFFKNFFLRQPNQRDASHFEHLKVVRNKFKNSLKYLRIVDQIMKNIDVVIALENIKNELWIFDCNVVR